MLKRNIEQKYGGLKIVWHPEKLISIKNEIITAPICVRVKPTNKCDHRCFYCSYDPEAESKNILSNNILRNDEIPFEKMIEILDDFKEIGVKAITFSGGGEPLIYPRIEEVLEKALENGIDVSIITNGQKLDGKKAVLLARAKWVRISLDSCRPETFTKSRRVPEVLFSSLVENIRNFSKIKNKNCELGINFVVHHINKDEVYEAAKFFKELGVNHIKFTPRWIDEKGKWKEYHSQFKNNVIEQIKRAKEELIDNNFAIFDTYENDFKLTGVPERTYSKCPIMQIVPVIGADSIVYFCHDKTYNDDGALGSLKDKSFKELWFSKESAEKFKNFNPMINCRQHCTYDSRNILVNDAIKSYDKDHINFP